MKKTMTLILCLFVLVFLFPLQNVKANSEVFGYTEEEINDLSNEEFVNEIMKIVHGNQEFTFAEKQEALEEIGVSIVNMTQISLLNSRSTSTSDSNGELSLTSIKRSGQPYHYLTSSVIAKSIMSTNYSREDVISIEWDPSTATYYSVTDGQYCSYRDGSNRSNGIVLFNLYDSNFTAIGKYSYVSVMVTPVRPSGIDLTFGTKWIHTYKSPVVSTTTTFNVGYQVTGPTGGYTVSVTESSTELTSQLYADNVLYL